MLFALFLDAKIIRVGDHFAAYFTLLEHDSRLVNQTCLIKKFTNIKEAGECLKHCIRHKRCATFNFNRREERCELLKCSKFDGLGFVRKAVNWTHFETDGNVKKVYRFLLFLYNLVERGERGLNEPWTD